MEAIGAVLFLLLVAGLVLASWINLVGSAKMREAEKLYDDRRVWWYQREDGSWAKEEDDDGA